MHNLKIKSELYNMKELWSFGSKSKSITCTCCNLALHRKCKACIENFFAFYFFVFTIASQ